MVERKWSRVIQVWDETTHMLLVIMKAVRAFHYLLPRPL